MIETVMKDVFAKISRVFTGLTNCQLEFVTNSSILISQWSAQELEPYRENRADRPSYIKGDGDGLVGFPVTLNGVFAGLVIVSGWRGANPDQLLQLAELLALILESSLEGSERASSLRALQERLHLVDRSNNVVPLRPTRLKEELDVERILALPEKPVSLDTALSKLSLLVEIPDGFPFHRIAHELHEMSARWAFVALENLAPDILESVDSLKALGGVTLYISDLAALTATQQMYLAQYLTIQPNEDMPQIVAGIMVPVERARGEGRVLAGLLDSFCISRLDWTERTGKQVTSDLIDASLRFILERARETALRRFGMGGSPSPNPNPIPMNIYQFQPRPPTLH
jgi:hypothetical protein